MPVPLLFLDPRVRKLAVTETVTGRCELDEDMAVVSEVESVGGEIAVDAAWTRANTALAKRHLDRYDPKRESVLRAVSGALVIGGGGQYKVSEPDGDPLRPGVVTLRPRLNDHPALRDKDGRGDLRWRIRVGYTPDRPADGWTPLVWLTPSFTPNAERRSLDLLVQWNTSRPSPLPTDLTPPTAKTLARVTVNAPTEWGEVDQLTVDDVELTVVGRRSATERSIEWRKAKVAPSTRGQRMLSMSFQHVIDGDARITGEVEVLFERALSGITDVHLHAAGGARRKDRPTATVQTKVVVAFDLRVARGSYQSVRVVPDLLRDEDTRDERRHYEGVVPDAQLVAKLVSVLGGHRHLVKSVVESPARPGSHAGVQNRMWDITGRWYHGVHPTDFRLTVSGEETGPGAEVPPSTQLRLLVHGAYATGEMEEQIIGVHTTMWSRCDSVLAASAMGLSGHQRLGEESLAAASARTADLENVLISVRSAVTAADRGGRLPTDFVRQIVDDIDSNLGARGRT